MFLTIGAFVIEEVKFVVIEYVVENYFGSIETLFFSFFVPVVLCPGKMGK
jgi:hypothetical protein